MTANYLLLAPIPTPGPHHEMLSRVCLGLTRAPVSALQVSGTASIPLRHGTAPRTAPLFLLLPLLSLPSFAFLRQVHVAQAGLSLSTCWFCRDAPPFALAVPSVLGSGMDSSGKCFPSVVRSFSSTGETGLLSLLLAEQF